MSKTLTGAERATIMDACQSISRSADALRDCHTVDGDWGDDVDAKAFYDAELQPLERLTALLGTQQPEPREFILYEHDDGRFAVSASADVAHFTRGDPAWHRVGPVTVYGPQPEPRDEVTALIEAAERVVEADRACALDDSEINVLASAIDAVRAGDGQ
ncbi:hypothetical protein [Burkholderia sp. Ac-20344]|uniref:hypothetical protein n=1 Tax=Burkholderia sp. Ac-20344 TaxID=2703890 RepID=UPI00197C0A07|nr:hypothetical protein [Burkholderia sp. Ac-20344]MBN3832902.1 hypothetical protein [Burkholderia sp. Ac-20344]